MRNSKGFSLVELMVVVAIIGIIGAIGYPAYMEYVFETRRSTAQADLIELSQWMDRRYTASYDYRDGGSNPTLPFTTSPQLSGKVFYNISFSSAVTQNAFTIQAVPTGVQSSDTCGTLTITSTGVKSAAQADCW